MITKRKVIILLVIVCLALGALIPFVYSQANETPMFQPQAQTDQTGFYLSEQLNRIEQNFNAKLDHLILVAETNDQRFLSFKEFVIMAFVFMPLLNGLVCFFVIRHYTKRHELKKRHELNKAFDGVEKMSFRKPPKKVYLVSDDDAKEFE